MQSEQERRIEFVNGKEFRDKDMSPSIVVGLLDHEFGSHINRFHYYKIEKGLNKPNDVIDYSKPLIGNHRQADMQKGSWVNNYTHEFYQRIFTRYELRWTDELRTYVYRLMEKFHERKAKLWELVDVMASGLEENRLQIYFYDSHIIYLNEILHKKHSGQIDRVAFISEPPRVRIIPPEKGTKELTRMK